MHIDSMVKQISLDSWQTKHMGELLRQGAAAVIKTGTPIILYRQILEEEDSSYEETVCTLTDRYIIEQRITSGGPVPPNIHEQRVFTIDEYPSHLITKSRDRFLQIVKLLENQLK